LSANYSSSVFESLYNEVNKRFAIDVNRIFSSGFSGGAKLAILFAQQYSYVAGVIACGASIPLVANYEPTYYYAGIIGSRDFNYLESNQTFALFDQKGYDYTSVLFNGGHEWPGITSFEMGMYGLEIYSIKTKKTSHTDVWLNALMNRLEDSITMQMQSNDLFAAHQTLRQYSRWFYGLKSIKEIHQQELAIQKNPEFADIIRKKQRLLKKEVSLRSDFIRAIELRDLEWWDAEIANIRKSICSEDIEVALVSHRLLNYLSMAAFMLTKTDLDDGRLDDARKKVTIYKLVDPDNPDAYLMEARFYMLIDDIPSMLESFKKSQQLGFNDYDTYKRESSWKDLMEQKEIQKLLE